MNIGYLTNQLLYSTVKLEVLTNQGVGTGTGFFFEYADEKNQEVFPLLVTNRHVVEENTMVRFQLHGAENGAPTKKNSTVEITRGGLPWIMHPHSNIDLCALPMAPILTDNEKKGHPIFIRSITNGFVPTTEQLEQLHAVEDIITAGYPQGIIDSLHNFPIFRKGITASHPAIDFNGEPVMLADIACYPGCSGSPVCIHNTGGYLANSTLMLGEERLLFLGVISSVHYWDGIQLTSEPVPTQTLQSPKQVMNLARVIKAEEVVNLAKHVVALARR